MKYTTIPQTVMCAVCRRPVETIISERDFMHSQTLVLLRCHGEEERVTIKDMDLLCAKSFSFTGAAFSQKKLGAPLGRS